MSHRPDVGTLHTVVELATRAPSVHNTQPWQWRIGQSTVHLYADESRRLTATDPVGRDLLISCGAALHHLRVAFAAEGWRCVVHRLPNPAEPAHLAAVEIHRHEPAAADIRRATAIMRRRTDRRRFSSWPVPAELIDLLAEAATEQGVMLERVAAPGARGALASAIAAAAAAHRDDDAQVVELALWSGLHGAPDGVPATNIPPAGTRYGDILMRQFPGAELPVGATADLEEGTELLVLYTTSDDRLSWLQTGEATSAVLLLATEIGFASSPLSEPLEVENTRRMVRDDVLDDHGYPQMVLRVGWLPLSAPPLPATPRRALADVVHSLAPTE